MNTSLKTGCMRGCISYSSWVNTNCIWESIIMVFVLINQIYLRYFYYSTQIQRRRWTYHNAAVYKNYATLMIDDRYQTQTIPGIGIEVLVFWPVLVLVLKIPNFQVLVLVLVLKNWFCRYWNWYWYWPQKTFIPQASADIQNRYKNTNCNN